MYRRFENLRLAMAEVNANLPDSTWREDGHWFKEGLALLEGKERADGHTEYLMAGRAELVIVPEIPLPRRGLVAIEAGWFRLAIKVVPYFPKPPPIHQMLIEWAMLRTTAHVLGQYLYPHADPDDADRQARTEIGRAVKRMHRRQIAAEDRVVDVELTRQAAEYIRASATTRR